MGTRADFYVGRGEQAEWLGSIAWDGYPSGIGSAILESSTEAGFKNSITVFLGERKDKTLPEHGWPWPWKNSQTTDYAYAFEAGKVWASSFGTEWFDPLLEEPEHESLLPKVSFPDMTTAKQREKFGKHSGVMVIGITPSE